jgi:hypothetical protein
MAPSAAPPSCSTSHWSDSTTQPGSGSNNEVDVANFLQQGQYRHQHYQQQGVSIEGNLATVLKGSSSNLVPTLQATLPPQVDPMTLFTVIRGEDGSPPLNNANFSSSYIRPGLPVLSLPILYPSVDVFQREQAAAMIMHRAFALENMLTHSLLGNLALQGLLPVAEPVPGIPRPLRAILPGVRHMSVPASLNGGGQCGLLVRQNLPSPRTHFQSQIQQSETESTSLYARANIPASLDAAESIVIDTTGSGPPQRKRQRVEGRQDQDTSPFHHSPVDLYMKCDDEILSDHQIMIRRNIEYFEVGNEEINATSHGRRRDIRLGQVGIRCKHCAVLPSRQRPKGAVYYPSTLRALYQAAQNMAATHFTLACEMIDEELKEKFKLFQESRASAGHGGKKYWSDCARAVGIVETITGLKFNTE